MPAETPSEGLGSNDPGPSSRLPATELPSLSEMEDTLAYVWRHFLDELLAARTTDPAGGAVDRDWGGARVNFRLAPLTGGTPGHVLVLSVRGGEPPFRLGGSLQLDKDGEPAPEGVIWQAFGDHEELVAWMVPWVALHVERGGGWIDF